MRSSHQPPFTLEIQHPADAAATGRKVAGNWPGSGRFKGRRTDRRAGGSALILSIATIVMLVMLGAAYLQVARTDRRTAADVDTRSNQEDGSILRFIGGVLAGDLPEGYEGIGPEPYDVPWSNNAEPWTVPDLYSPTVVPGPVPNLTNGDQPAREPRANAALADAAGRTQAQGGELDDPWLASIEPFFTGIAGAVPYWAHITNLSGVFLDLADIAPGNDTVPSSARPMPAQYLATAEGTSGWTPNANQERSDVAYTVPAVPMGLLSPAELGIFADADRDNIADSRWTWAPLPYEGGQAAIMAVRIIDNSALVNVNAWSYRQPSQATQPARWLWPGELDLDSALEGIKFRSGAGSVLSEDILGDAAPAGRNMAGDTFADRLDNWLELVNTRRNGWDNIGSKIEQDGTVDGVESLNDPTNTYATYPRRQEEIEFHHRNGLNDEDITTSFENVDNALFRSGATETVYSDSLYGGPAGTEGDIEPYFVNEPRKAFTFVSGSAALGQENLNRLLKDELREVLDLGPLTSNLYTYGGWTTADAYADQLACILIDFRDRDSELTEINQMYGMEYLPFVSEVYLQGRYEKTTVNGGSATPTLSGNDEVIWELANVETTAGVTTTNSFAVAIEIVNPWPWTIEMPDVEVLVVDDAGVSRSWGTLDALTGGKATLAGDEVIILTRDDSVAGGGDNTEITAIEGSAATAPVNTVTTFTMTTAQADRWPVGNNAAGIVLAALTDEGNRVGYQEFAVGELPQTALELYADTQGGAIGDTGYYQITALGTGDGLSALTVRDIDVDLQFYASTAPSLLTQSANIPDGIQPTAPLPVAGTSQFGTALKGASSPDAALPAANRDLDDRIADYFTGANAPAAGDEPWIIGNAGRFYRAGDILRAVMLGPRNNGTVTLPVAEVWELFRANRVAAGDTSEYFVADAMLDVNDGTPVGTAAEDLNIPHAAYYMALLNTIDVNDGDGGLIPGRPNINTMPERVLAEILPTLNTTAGYDVALANAIVSARETPDDPGSGVGRSANLKGIAYPAQLGFLPAVYDGTAAPANEVTDFNEYEPEITHATNPTPGGAAVVDAYGNDIEEQTMLLNYLNQVVSTRSDVFTAYVRVRLYPANDFSANGDTDGDGIFDPTDEYFLVATFDRSSVTGQGLPRILAVKRYEADP